MRGWLAVALQQRRDWLVPPGFDVFDCWLFNVVMPSSGVMTRDHWCVAYGDEAHLGADTSWYLSEGLAQGEQVGFFGWGTVEDLRAPLTGLDHLDALIDAGRARVGSFGKRFRLDEPPDPAALVSFWDDATEEALTAGFSGLRVVADTTPWAGLRRDQRAVFLQGEQLLNRYRHRKPFTLICACDASALSAEALTETASIHPLTQGVSTPFCLYATDAADFAVQGEIDALGVALFERLLESVPASDAGDRLVIDASGLGFIEHRSLLALERHAERRDLSVVLARAPGVAGRIAGLLDLRRVRLQGAP